MIIPQKLKNKWIALRSPGDAQKVADLAAQKGIECSYETVNRAFRSGKCNDDVFRIMADFYEEKSKLIKEYL